jgi:uncharacterized membrane protein (DUF4010 family)
VNGHIDILRSMGIATLIGALIGLEREYTHQLKGEKGFAGLRTFMFYALLGNVSAWLTKIVSPAMLPLGFAALALLVTVTYFRGSMMEWTDRGMTTEVAALLTFLLGALVATGEVETAVAVGVIVAVLLSAKPALLRWVERITTEDIYTTLKFAVITFVVLPILPNHHYGPLQAFNPHEIWIMVVLISGVSFLGYVAYKLYGPERGIALSGLLGGLASSTAVSLSFGRRSKDNPALAKGCAMAITVASTVMVARIAVLVAVVQISLFRYLWIPLVALGVSGVATSLWLWRGSRHDTSIEGGLEIQNPFRLTTVIAFGVAFALVLFLVKAADRFLPVTGTPMIAAISGLTQVDAITLSVAKLTGPNLSANLAVGAILIAALSNTLSKALIGISVGHRNIRRPLLTALGIVFLSGLATLPIVYFLP